MKLNTPIIRLLLGFIVVCSSMLFGEQLTVSADTAGANGRISGAVWQDSNNNGIREPEELPLVGYPVYLQRTGEEVVGAMVAVVHTDEEGLFIFDTLEEGQYKIFLETGSYVLVDVVGVNATTTIELPVQFHQVFLPLTVH